MDQSKYKQKFSDGTISDSGIFMISMVLLILEQNITNSSKIFGLIHNLVQRDIVVLLVLNMSKKHLRTLVMKELEYNLKSTSYYRRH